jgi:hypothetical protein
VRTMRAKKSASVLLEETLSLNLRSLAMDGTLIYTEVAQPKVITILPVVNDNVPVLHNHCSPLILSIKFYLLDSYGSPK